MLSRDSISNSRPHGPGDIAYTPVTVPPAQLLFGLGTEADGDLTAALTAAAPISMLTSWFNGTSDLNWMTSWRNDVVPNAYAAGYALHLIIFAGDATISTINTAYGTAHGRAYPLSAQFQTDAVALAKIWAGPANGPPLYVSMFTEFQEYAQTSNSWLPETNYWKAFKDAYNTAMAAFRLNAPNSQVSLCWGGWQARYDDPSLGGGRSMFPHFADVMTASDFSSFQLMQDDSNVADFITMTQTLAAYKKPVVVAHYKPNAAGQPTFHADITSFFTDAFMAARVADGLNAFSFMDQQLLVAPDYATVVAAVNRYGIARPVPSAPLHGGGGPPPPPPGGPPADLQAAINGTASGGTLDITNGVYTGSYSISKPITMTGGKITAAGNIQTILAINASNVTIDGIEISGVGNTNGFCYGIGPYAANGLVIKNSYIHDVAYAGIGILNTNGGTIQNNHIARIGYGNDQASGTNAYGIFFSDDNGGSNPTRNMLCDSNLIEDVPSWQGINTHNGQSLTWTNNIVRRCRRAYWMYPSSGRIANCVVKFNRAETPHPVTYDPTGYFLGQTDNTTYDQNWLSTDYPHPSDGGDWKAYIEDYGSGSSGLTRTNTTLG